MADLARAYVVAINTGAVPTIASAWESVVRIEGAKALDGGKEAYVKAYVAQGCRRAAGHRARSRWSASIGGYGPSRRLEAGVTAKGGIVDADELTTLHNQARQNALSVYRQLAIGGYQKEFDEELEAFMTSTYDKAAIDNLNKSTEQCRQLLANMLQRLSADVKTKRVRHPPSCVLRLASACGVAAPLTSAVVLDA